MWLPALAPWSGNGFCAQSPKDRRAGKPRLKLSSSKVLYPGRKQVFRPSRNRTFLGDIIGRFSETRSGKPLLLPVIRAGVPLTSFKLDDSRKRLRLELSRLVPALRALDSAEPPYLVTFSHGLQEDLDQFPSRLARYA